MEIELENGLRLRINKDDHTSSIISSPKASKNILVPSFINYQGEKYILKSVESYSFSNTKIDSITFANDSEVETFKNNSFDCAHIKKLQIPNSLKNLKSLSLSCIYDLTEIEVSPKNKLFSFIDDQFLVGKIDDKSKNYDILYFARTDIENAIISPTIKILNSYSFFNHKQLQSIIFPFNSKLKIIQNNVFSFTSIKKLVLPETVVEIDGSNFGGVPNLVEIEVSPKNKVFSYVDRKFLAKKCHSKSRFFDVIVFVRRDIEEFKVPSYIKRISENAFQSCNKLKSILFDSMSSLEVIEKEAFFNICGPEVLIVPSSVKRIGDQAFSHIKNLRFVEIDGKEVEIDFSPFCACRNLDVISFPNATQITFNCDYCFDQIPEETEFHMRRDVTLAGKGLDELQRRIEFIESSDDSKNKISKFKLKTANFDNKTESIEKVQTDEKLNEDKSSSESILANAKIKAHLFNDNKSSNYTNDEYSSKENYNNSEYSSNYNYIDTSSTANVNSNEYSSSDKELNNSKNFNKINVNMKNNKVKYSKSVSIIEKDDKKTVNSIKPEANKELLNNNISDDDKFMILMDYIRHIEKRLSEYEKVEPFDFDSYQKVYRENPVKIIQKYPSTPKSVNKKICDFKCAICNNVIENDIIFISDVSYHKKCVTSQLSRKTVTSQKQIQDFPQNEDNSFLLLKNYNNLSPTKFLNSVKPQNNVSENKKSLISLIDNELIKSPYEIKVVDVKLIQNKFISEFEQNKAKVSSSSSSIPSIEERFLYHGTSSQNEEMIKQRGFKIQAEKDESIKATDNLYDAFLNANGNDSIEKDKTVSVIFCKSFYNKTKEVKIQENSSYDDQIRSEIKENYGVQIEVNQSKEIHSNQFKFLNESQIIPIFSLTVKIPSYFILWKVSQIDEDVKTYKRTFLSILHVNFYCFKSFDKALEMIKLKKKNPIRLITNIGENSDGLRFIKDARKIIGSSFLCLIFDKKIENLNQTIDIENVLCTTNPQFFGKFASLPMDENKQLNFIDDLQKQSGNQSFKINRNEMLKFPLFDGD